MTATAARPRRRWTGLALVVAASLTAAGCGTVSAGSAAVAGDRRVPVGQVQNATAQLADITGPQGAFPQEQVLEYLIIEPWVVDIAAKYGVGVSQDDALGAIRRQNPAYDPASNKTPHKTADPETITAARGYLALNAIRGVSGALDQAKAQQAVAELQAVAKAAHVEINPRYSGETPDWLVATPTASATTGAGTGSGDGTGTGSGDGSGTGATPQPTATP